MFRVSQLDIVQVSKLFRVCYDALQHLCTELEIFTTKFPSKWGVCTLVLNVWTQLMEIRNPDSIVAIDVM